MITRFMKFEMSTDREVSISDFQMILPVGEFHTAKYGDLDISQEMVGALVDNWKFKALGERLPFIDTDHDQGAANGWIVELQAKDDGLYAKIEWTDIGRENVEQKRYRYFSAMIAEHKNIETGEKVWPVLKAVSLTNTPVMDTMPAVTLNDKTSHGEGDTISKVENMDFEALLKAFGELKANLTPEQITQLSDAIGVKKVEPVLSDGAAAAKAKEKTIESLQKSVEDLTAMVVELTEKNQEETENVFFARILSEGRIAPVDVQEWKDFYRKDPSGTSKLLEKLPKKIDLSVAGSASGGGEAYKLPEAKRKTLKEQLHLTDEQIDKEFSGKE